MDGYVLFERTEFNDSSKVSCDRSHRFSIQLKKAMCKMSTIQLFTPNGENVAKVSGWLWLEFHVVKYQKMEAAERRIVERVNPEAPLHLWWK